MLENVHMWQSQPWLYYVGGLIDYCWLDYHMLFYKVMWTWWVILTSTIVRFSLVAVCFGSWCHFVFVDLLFVDGYSILWWRYLAIQCIYQYIMILPLSSNNWVLSIHSCIWMDVNVYYWVIVFLLQSIYYIKMKGSIDMIWGLQYHNYGFYILVLNQLPKWPDSFFSCIQICPSSST